MPDTFAEQPLLDPSATDADAGERIVLRDILTSFERNLIVTVLTAAGGNQKRAAEALGVLPTTFQEKLKRFGLLNQRFGRSARGGERAQPRSEDPAPFDEAPQTPQEMKEK